MRRAGHTPWASPRPLCLTLLWHILVPSCDGNTRATLHASSMIPKAVALVICSEGLPSQAMVAYYSPPASSTSAGESYTGRVAWRRYHEATRLWTTQTTPRHL